MIRSKIDTLVINRNSKIVNRIVKIINFEMN